MKDYLKLQEGKARKKAHKDKRKAARLAAGTTADDRHAHSLSPSSLSSSQSELGELVPSPFVGKSGLRLDSVDIIDSVNVDGGDIDRFKNIACTPSVLPPR